MAPTRAKALWAYTALEDNELSFEADQIIEVIELCNEDWFEGRIGDAVGFFPANRVELVDESDHDGTAADNVVPDEPSVESTAPDDKGNDASPPATVPVDPAPVAEPEAVDTLAASDGGDPFADEDGSDADDDADSEDQQRPGLRPEEESAAVLVSPPALKDATLDVSSETGAVIFGEVGEAEELKSGSHEAWKAVLDPSGDTYYWNERTGETTWDLPVGYDAHSLSAEDQSAADNSFQTAQAEAISTNPLSPAGITTGTDFDADENLSNDISGLDLNTSLVDQIPADLIKKEGAMKRKLKRNEDGIKDGRISTWKSCYAVLCVGVMIFFKDAPSKSKKSAAPLDLIPLSNVTLEFVGRDSSKKNTFTLATEGGTQWLLLPDSDPLEWIDAIKSFGKERVTTSEYESAISRLFSRSKSESDLLSVSFGSRSRRGTATSKDREALASDTKSQTRSKLTAFFSKRASSKGKDKLSSDVDPVFGGLLESQTDRVGRRIPEIVELCCLEVERRGLLSQGIYRISGNASTVQKFRAMVNAHEPFNISSEDVDINIVASLLKLYFRELPNPLIPNEFYEQFISSAKLPDYNERLIQFKVLIQSLPPCNYYVLHYILMHLGRVATESETNKMERSNLAIVWAPTLIPSLSIANLPLHNMIIESLLEQSEWLFDGKSD